MSSYYILDGHEAVKADLMTWSKWYGTADHSVAKTAIGPASVSTVFLGIDHSFGSGAPLLFETMVFCGKHDEFQERCTTWEQAEAQHAKVCAMVRESA